MTNTQNTNEEAQYELDQESPQALLLEEAYQLGYMKVKNGCLQEPLKKLNALINTEVLKALDSIEVPKKIDMKHAIRTHSDAGAGTVIGNNHCVDKILKAIKEVKEKYTV